MCDFESAANATATTAATDGGTTASAPARSDDDISTTCLLKEIILTRLSDLQTCTEYLPESGRAGYSIFILLFQFLLPMITLVCAYYQICQTLRLRLEQRVRQRNAHYSVNGGTASTLAVAAAANGNKAAGGSSGNLADRRNSVLRRNDERRERNIMRLKRTIKLLCWIGAIFCICWLPLNILNALRDCTTYTDTMTEELFCGIYAVCHVLGMSSACANPVIYGFLNENFSKEFQAIGRWWLDRGKALFGWCAPGGGGGRRNGAARNGRTPSSRGGRRGASANNGSDSVGGIGPDNTTYKAATPSPVSQNNNVHHGSGNGGVVVAGQPSVVVIADGGSVAGGAVGGRVGDAEESLELLPHTAKTSAAASPV